MSGSPPIAVSQLDTERFGVRIARASAVTADRLPALDDFCRRHAVRMLVARCPATDLAAVQAMERAGFQLMDTLLYYQRDLTRQPFPDVPRNIPVRPARPNEADAVRDVAAAAFRDYYGHYHADPRLDRAACDAAYVDWAHRSCLSRDVADEVLVAVRDGAVAGFATLKWNSSEEGDGVLFAVHPSAQGRGIYTSFVLHAMEWFAARGGTRMVISTQVTNIAVQRSWALLGFAPSHAFYTLHRWFD